MKFELIDRGRLKREMRDTLRTAQVSPKAMTALYMGLCTVLTMIDLMAGSKGILAIFSSVLTSLISLVLGAGFVMYCMAVLRGERAEFLTLFDGFSLAGKLIMLSIVKYAYIILWSLLFVIPGIIAAYRYRFAAYNLYENPDLGIFEALELSKRQTLGYKQQLFMLDLSYFGWSILATLPIMAENFIYSYQVTCQQFGIASGVFTVPQVSPTAYLLWTLFTCLWQLLVALFYLPVYQCTELGYYETAKASSGLDPTQRRSPDGL